MQEKDSFSFAMVIPNDSSGYLSVNYVQYKNLRFVAICICAQVLNDTVSITTKFKSGLKHFQSPNVPSLSTVSVQIVRSTKRVCFTKKSVAFGIQRQSFFSIDVPRLTNTGRR